MYRVGDPKRCFGLTHPHGLVTPASALKWHPESKTDDVLHQYNHDVRMMELTP
jgi:hypothetical protein